MVRADETEHVDHRLARSLAKRSSGADDRKEVVEARLVLALGCQRLTEFEASGVVVGVFGEAALQRGEVDLGTRRQPGCCLKAFDF